VLWACRDLYNSCLASRRTAYTDYKVSLSWVEQCRHLTSLRNRSDRYSSFSRGIQTEVIKKLDKAYSAFFRRLESGEVAGFPRFKGRDYYKSFEYAVDQRQQSPLRGDKIFIQSIGSCRVRLSRPIEGAIKILRVIKRADGWFLQLVCDNPKPKAFPKTGKEVGIDAGITNFITLNNGETVSNPHFVKKAAEKLASIQRRKELRKKGSNRRRILRQLEAKAHLKVSRSRRHFHYQIANNLVSRFDKIYVEDLKVKQMVETLNLPKQILDVAWAGFFQILSFKAANAEKLVEKVCPAYTSQTCSECGHVSRENRKTQAKFACVECGFTLNADHNAAKNISARGGDSSRKRAVNTAVRVKEMSDALSGLNDSSLALA
jgi:putative transposase